MTYAIRSIRGPARGRWEGPADALHETPDQVRNLLRRIATPAFAVGEAGSEALAVGGRGCFESTPLIPNQTPTGVPLHAWVPPCPIESLGDPSFREEHGARMNLVAGAMAGGIAAEELVSAMARAGMLAFFGAAGLPVTRVERAIDRLADTLFDRPWGVNLIHSPSEPRLEADLVDLLLARGVRRISASAYMDLSLPLLRYRLTGIRREDDGRIVTPHHVVAKVSRVEVARRFFSPPPQKFLDALVARGDLSSEQAAWARDVPVATDVTAEADSGGHTDNRPAFALLPTMLSLRDELQPAVPHHRLRVGAAGGIATPHAVAAAFALGAAYVLTGSINQSCVEAGTSPAVRAMLAEADGADVAMAPAADMFEMGVQLQVLKRGTMFPMRAHKLYQLYRTRGALEELSTAERKELEDRIFARSLDEVWAQTQAYWAQRDPSQIERAHRDPRHRMALTFRWYLGQSSRWANTGEPDRRLDYQIWCGPAMGAFNAWVRGSWLEPLEHRQVVAVSLNLLHGAAVLRRIEALRTAGLWLRPDAIDLRPRPPAALEELHS